MTGNTCCLSSVTLKECEATSYTFSESRFKQKKKNKTTNTSSRKKAYRPKVVDSEQQENKNNKKKKETKNKLEYIKQMPAKAPDACKYTQLNNNKRKRTGFFGFAIDPCNQSIQSHTLPAPTALKRKENWINKKIDNTGAI